MKIHPILFSTPMVQAILAGTKTQTRRIVKHKNKIEEITKVVRCVEKETDWNKYKLTDELGEDFIISSPNKKGDILWVRETFYAYGHWTTIIENEKQKKVFHDLTHDNHYIYQLHADWKPIKEAKFGELGWHKRPSLFMPKEACRLFLEVVNVRLEKLQDISESDAIAEGVLDMFRGKDIAGNAFMNYMDKKGGWDSVADNAIHSYQTLWQKINGINSWDKNPYVWVYDFKIVNKPINY